MFTREILERDPTEKASHDQQMIRSSLDNNQSLDQLSSRVPLVHINQQVTQYDTKLQAQTSEIKDLSSQMKIVLEFFSRVSNKERTKNSQSFVGQGQLPNKHSREVATSQVESISCFTAQSPDRKNQADDTEKNKRAKSSSSQNKLILGAAGDWASNHSEMQAEHDEIDLAITKCLEDQTSLKKL